MRVAYSTAPDGKAANRTVSISTSTGARVSYTCLQTGNCACSNACFIMLISHSQTILLFTKLAESDVPDIDHIKFEGNLHMFQRIKPLRQTVITYVIILVSIGKQSVLPFSISLQSYFRFFFAKTIKRFDLIKRVRF